MRNDNCTRVAAMYWWNCLTEQMQYKVTREYMNERDYRTLTGREIEYIFTLKCLN